MKRTKQTRVRLVKASDGPALQVLLFTEEHAALEAAAARMTPPMDLSSFLREAGLWGSGKPHDYAWKANIEEAATAAGMSPGEWLRTMALTAIGYTPLRAQMDRALAGWQAGFPR